KLVAQPQRKRQIPRGVRYDDADRLIAILFTEVRTDAIEIACRICRIIRINSQILDEDKWRVRGFRLDSGVQGLAYLAKPWIYGSVFIKEQNAARQRLRLRRDVGQGHRQAKHDTHHNPTRSATRHSNPSLRADHLSIFRLARDAKRNGTNLLGFWAVHMIPPACQRGQLRFSPS